MTHPIADLALRSLLRGPRGLELAASARAPLVEALAAVSHQREPLVAAVEALVSLAHYLDAHEGAAAAKALLEVASTAIDALAATSTPRALDRMQDRARAFARFDARTPAPRAPMAVFASAREPSPFRRAPRRV